LDGVVVGPGLKVQVELMFVGWWVETAEDGLDKGPHVFGLFKGARKNSLGSGGEVEIRFVEEEPV